MTLGEPARRPALRRHPKADSCKGISYFIQPMLCFNQSAGSLSSVCQIDRSKIHTATFLPFDLCFYSAP